MSAFVNTHHTRYSQKHTTIDQDGEIAVIKHLVESVTNAGICKDPIDVVNFFVALKSKPLLILSGPPNSGKTTLVQCFARTIIRSDCTQCQMLVGHPWSAENSGNVAFFTGIHYRYNTEKMLSLIEEAWLTENRQRVFLACLIRISPAEIIDLFSSLSHQISHKYIHRIGDIHLSGPTPYPPNLWIIGTIDRRHFDWWEHDLLSNTVVLNWSKADDRIPNCPITANTISDSQIELLRSLRREKNEVFKKFHTVSGRIKQPLKRYFDLKSFLVRSGIALHDSITDEIVTYLANSWSRKGMGLFHPSVEKNLSISLDLAIAQILIPRIKSRIDASVQIKTQVLDLFSPDYSRSSISIRSK